MEVLYIITAAESAALVRVIDQETAVVLYLLACSYNLFPVGLLLSVAMRTLECLF